ncbi:MAG: glyoxylate/hydroxypyruvate reductase A [Phyllobacteriaceae bacterium]|nr:glyoxylate/hydroxypyruvate reductase A [Phyllobacteriaceae bacterium]
MTLLVAIENWIPELWLDRFRRLAPDLEVIDARAPFDPAAARFAAVWKPKPGLLAGLPKLEAIFNLGAGVDALLADPTLPHVPVVRIVDPDLTARMTEWVVMNVLARHRRMDDHRAAQGRAEWRSIHQPAAGSVTVGLMGLGVLGKDAAAVLGRLGFDLVGWSRSRQVVAGVETFAGAAELPAFLARTDVLVVLLPATPETRGMLNRDLFRGLRGAEHLGGPVLINAGRGSLQVEADIVAALDAGELAHAVLDVFEVEPLPKTSPLWAHPKVTITPHCAADSDADALGRRVIGGIRALMAGEAIDPAEVVDRRRGY